jgi:hypothetical protein
MAKLLPYLDELAALFLVVGCLALLFCHIDDEVKSIFTLAAGWLFKGGYTHARNGKGRGVKK